MSNIPGKELDMILLNATKLIDEFIIRLATMIILKNIFHNLSIEEVEKKATKN